MLEANLKSSNNKNANALTNDGASDGKPSDVDDDFDVPEEVENVIQELLTALKDKETIIR